MTKLTTGANPARLAAILVLVGFSAAANADQVTVVPVMIGDGPDFDACGAQAAVTGLDPQGDNFLAVRAGPGSDHTQIDTLHQDDLVNVCHADGRWIGIVYAPGDSMTSGTTDCGVGTPITPDQAYDGVCRSGWVFEDYLTIVAG